MSNTNPTELRHASQSLGSRLHVHKYCFFMASEAAYIILDPDACLEVHKSTNINKCWFKLLNINVLLVFGTSFTSFYVTRNSDTRRVHLFKNLHEFLGKGT